MQSAHAEETWLRLAQIVHNQWGSIKGEEWGETEDNERWVEKGGRQKENA
jgi:hypothetical protein